MSLTTRLLIFFLLNVTLHALQCPVGQVSTSLNSTSQNNLQKKECSGSSDNTLCVHCCSYSYISNTTSNGAMEQCVAWASTSSGACIEETPVSSTLTIQTYDCDPNLINNCQACNKFESTVADVSLGSRTKVDGGGGRRVGMAFILTMLSMLQ